MDMRALRTVEVDAEVDGELMVNIIYFHIIVRITPYKYSLHFHQDCLKGSGTVHVVVQKELNFYTDLAKQPPKGPKGDLQLRPRSRTKTSNKAHSLSQLTN